MNSDSQNDQVKRLCPLPHGSGQKTCPKCHGKNITGAIISKTADESDPDMLCSDCGFWW